MADLKDYLVRVDYNQWNDIYIASAKNAKEAIDIVYETQFADRKESDKAKGFVPYKEKSKKKEEADK